VLIERFDVTADDAAARAWYEAYVTGAPVDEPGGCPPMSPRVWRGLMARGWCAEPRENWLARGQAGGPGETVRGETAPGEVGEPVLGWYSLELPDRENLDRAGLTLLVAPERRRTGVGSALLRHALARAAELGRDAVTSLVLQGTPGDRFARAMGAAAELIEARRTLDVATLSPGHLARLRASAEGAAAGYTLTSWDGPTPDQWLEPVAALNRAMADAPHGAGEQPQVWNADRVRLTDQLSAEKGLRRYSIAAADTATGELAALTQLSVDEEDPAWGHQEMTAVVRAHRGHRLGLLTKVAMLELLADREPRVRFVQTFNGEANAHMVAINETLGFRQTARITAWIRPARVPGETGPLATGPLAPTYR
jgi:GNAT superfamily N-acetyltransferase